jgi:polyphosphate kinase
LRKRQRKKWKSSPIDEQAQEKWRYYTLAKMKALELTDTKHAPWLVINSEEKFLSAIEILKHIISTTDDIKKLVESDL